MDLRIRSRVGVTKDDAARVARDMRKAAAPWPNDPAVQAALAEAEFDAGDLDAADSAAARAIAADPKNVDGHDLSGEGRVRTRQGLDPGRRGRLEGRCAG